MKTKYLLQQFVCKTCGKSFSRKIYKGDSSPSFCSKECRDKRGKHLVKINCLVCGKEKYYFKSHIAIGYGKYCSKECAHIGSRGKHWTLPKKGKIIKCLFCGKEKYYQPHVFKRGQGRFCGRGCAAKYHMFGKHKSEQHRKHISENHHDVSGKNNPNWRGGISNEVTKWRNKNWKKLLSFRNEVLKRDGYKCKLCGTTENLEVHHIIPASETRLTAFLPMNGITLCRKCHKQTDSYGGKSRFNKKIEEGIGKTICLMRVIPHKFQAYETVGNYAWTDDGVLVIFVSDLGNEDYEHAIFLHEFIEASLCKKRGIKEEDITNFDTRFEKDRLKGLHSKTAEPGNSPKAPYHREHLFATKLEKMFIKELGYKWKDYDKLVESL